VQDEDRRARRIARLRPVDPLAVAYLKQAVIERGYVRIKHVAVTQGEEDSVFILGTA
jgi:hypothetical protein